jgi:hypothetical protein
MANRTQEIALKDIGRALSEVLSELYGQEMGYLLVVSPLNTPMPVADYISNADRESGIEWLRETADRLDANQDIPASIGEG